VRNDSKLDLKKTAVLLDPSIKQNLHRQPRNAHTARRHGRSRSRETLDKLKTSSSLAKTSPKPPFVDPAALKLAS